MLHGERAHLIYTLSVLSGNTVEYSKHTHEACPLDVLSGEFLGPASLLVAGRGGAAGHRAASAGEE